MLFTLNWTHTTNARNKTITQFLATGGLPPEGVEMISRYHNIDGSGGFAVCKSIDSAALANWALDWNGLIDMKITPIMDDETAGAVMGPRGVAGDFN